MPATQETKIDRRTFLKNALFTVAVTYGGLEITKQASRFLPGWIRPKVASAGPTEGKIVTSMMVRQTEQQPATVNHDVYEYTQPAPRNPDGSWLLHNADGASVNVHLPDGFAPDVNLRYLGGALQLPADVSQYRDFQKALNTPDGTYPALAGYDPSIEYGDYCNNPPDHACADQLNMFSWEVKTGEKAQKSQIGSLVGARNRSIMIMEINRDGSVHAWDNPPEQVVHGFSGGGPIWDGEHHIPETEKRLVGHYADRLLNGIPGMYRGACDNPNNCNEVLAVSVQRRQWGNNSDGSRRIIFELIRAEIIRK